MTKSITNQQNIEEWEKYDLKEISTFGDEGDLSRKLILTPTILNLVGNIKGLEVLDAGSGTGYLSRKLSQLGAKVTAIEPVKSLYNYSKLRENKEKLGIKFINEDLSTLKLIKSFDFVIANMVLQDIPEYEKAINNCLKLLKPNGKFIFSLSHPAFEGSTKDFINNKGALITEYLNKYTKKQRFGYAFHRTISEYFNTINNNGGRIINIIEPGITSKQAALYPELRKELHVPSFMFFVVERNSIILD